MNAFTQIVPLCQVLFGTDLPYRDSAHTVAGLAGSGISNADLDMIYRDNALRLLPRLH